MKRHFLVGISFLFLLLVLNLSSATTVYASGVEEVPAILANLQGQGLDSFETTRPLSTTEMAQIRGENLKAIYYLVKINMLVYRNLGWEIGRYQGRSRYGVDIGPYPGLSRAWWLINMNIY